MRIAVISDVHGNIVALEAVLKDIARRGADTTVSLGDVAFKGPAPSECVGLIRGLGMPSVRGNTDVTLAAMVGLSDNACADHDDPAIVPYLQWH
ncbi:MAG: metallophosphoesterase family protein, partial [Bacillota bacterium]